jgi:hypothetical protein
VLRIDVLGDYRLQQEVWLRSRLIIPCGKIEESTLMKVDLELAFVMHRINEKRVKTQEQICFSDRITYFVEGWANCDEKCDNYIHKLYV